jgi:hypothetical protein
MVRGGIKSANNTAQDAGAATSFVKIIWGNVKREPQISRVAACAVVVSDSEPITGVRLAKLTVKPLIVTLVVVKALL